MNEKIVDLVSFWKIIWILPLEKWFLEVCSNGKGMQEDKIFTIFFYNSNLDEFYKNEYFFFRFYWYFRKTLNPLFEFKYWGKCQTYLNGSVYQIERILDTLLAQIFSGTCPRGRCGIGLGGCWGLGGQTRNSTQGTWKVTKKNL